MQLSCREWLHDIAADYAACVGLTDQTAENSARTAAREAEGLLRLMPWHGRVAVGGVEIAASVFCLLDWGLHLARADPARAMRLFGKMPVIGSPLFRLYRSVVAATFFEQPEVLAALDVEAPEARQQRYRQLKKEAA